jgi:cell division protein FtsQ
MKLKFNIKRELKIGAAIAVLFFFIAFSERKQGTLVVNDIIVKVKNVEENYFLDEHDVIELMKLDKENLKGATLDRLNMKSLENKIKAHRFVQDAELYSDLKGNLIIETTLRRPIARIVRNDGPDAYIAEDGAVMPLTDKYTARVMLLSGAFARHLLDVKNLNESEDGKHLMEMLYMIREDEFWKAQIAQLDIDSKARVNIFPQVGNERIEFGKPENLESKFKKLRIFYKEILPQQGWGKYDRINLEYEGQIIAE